MDFSIFRVMQLKPNFIILSSPQKETPYPVTLHYIQSPINY